MRIMNRDEFLAIEGEVLFSRYHDGAFGDLEIKGGTFGEIDFTCQTLSTSLQAVGDEFFDEISRGEETGGDMAMDFDCLGRDGLYDQNQKFAVWSADDVKALIARLSRF